MTFWPLSASPFAVLCFVLRWLMVVGDGGMGRESSKSSSKPFCGGVLGGTAITGTRQARSTRVRV